MASTTAIYFSHNSKGWMSKIKVWAELFSSEASLLCLQVALFSLHFHKFFPLCLYLHGLILIKLPFLKTLPPTKITS